MRTIQRTGVSTFASRTSKSTAQSLQKSFHLSHADKIELKKTPSLLKIKNTQQHKPSLNETENQQRQWFTRANDKNHWL